MKMIFDEFQGKTAIITGAASGMGLLSAQKLAENGANVVMVDANPDAVKAAAQAICDLGQVAVPEVVDVRFYDDVEACCKRALERFGSVDILINCAGGASDRMRQSESYFPMADPEVLNWGIDVNFKGPMHFARALMASMIEHRSGVIINLGSTSGDAGSRSVDYSMSKSGLMGGLTKSLSLYGARYGVRCCCVAPGPVLTRAAMARMATSVGYAAEPWEVVDLILYLCSDNARSMTGATYYIDGGRHATALDNPYILKPGDTLDTI